MVTQNCVKNKIMKNLKICDLVIDNTSQSYEKMIGVVVKRRMCLYDIYYSRINDIFQRIRTKESKEILTFEEYGNKI